MNHTDLLVTEALKFLKDKKIKHYGVKGMKWGVRRSQRELDRAAGRGEFAKDRKRSRGKTERGTATREDGTQERAVRNKKTGRVASTSAEDRQRENVQRVISEFGTAPLSNKDLQAYASRIDLEKRIRGMQPKSKSDKAKKFVKDFGKAEGKRVVSSMAGSKKQAPKPFKEALWDTNSGKVAAIITDAAKNAKKP